MANPDKHEYRGTRYGIPELIEKTPEVLGIGFGIHPYIEESPDEDLEMLDPDAVLLFSEISGGLLGLL